MESCNGYDEDCDGKIDNGVLRCVSTWAGSTRWTVVRDGPGATATFGGPVHVAADPGSGALYVADALARKVRRVELASGEVTTVLGTGLYGSDPGLPLRASLVQPRGVAVGNDGSLIVVDFSTSQIWRVVGGTASIYAGSGFYGHQDGTAPLARFSGPNAVAVDPACAAPGCVYVADTENQVIRRINPGAPPSVETLAGGVRQAGDVDGAGDSARFDTPRGLAWDAANGILFIADTVNQKVRALDPLAGAVWTVAGGGILQEGFADGPAAAAMFDFPSAVAVRADGAVYVGDRYNRMVRLITTPQVTPAGPNSGVVTHPLTNLYEPVGLAVAGDDLYIAENFNARVSVVRPAAPSLAAVLAGTGEILVDDGGPLTASFGYTDSGTALSGTAFLLADQRACRIRRVDLVPGQGAVTTSVGGDGRCTTAGVPLRSLDRPAGLVVHPDHPGAVFVAAEGARAILKLTLATGAVDVVAGVPDGYGYTDGPVATARFKELHGMALDLDGALLVADANANAIRRIDLVLGQVTSLAGGSDRGWSDSADPRTALFAYPVDVAAAADGTLYVADHGNCAIRRIAPAPSRAVTTLAGGPSQCTFVTGALVDGPVALASLSNPSSVSVSPDGRWVAFADPFVSRVRAVDTTSLAVSTVLGNGNWGSVDGDLATSNIRMPWDAFFLPSGELIAVDQVSGLVRALGAL
ncbi:MAG: hypothetical protein HY904_09590 [Deltaproteobacteria bacterium]|nr:hypothetical protein [Deltaproteobacteria bacterium]